MNTPASTSDSSTPSHHTSSGQVSNAARLSVSRRQRGTPYTARIESLGVSDYSIVNHTILPKGFGYGVENDYWHLREHVQIWDVTCQRQVEITGVDAAYLVQLMTPRNMSNAAIGQCLYAPLIDDNAGMLNDPIILKLADDRFWLSIADSDVLLWAKGLAGEARPRFGRCFIGAR
jgi:dimethylsulfoniopropionate demethylase